MGRSRTFEGGGSSHGHGTVGKTQEEDEEERNKNEQSMTSMTSMTRIPGARRGSGLHGHVVAPGLMRFLRSGVAHLHASS